MLQSITEANLRYFPLEIYLNISQRLTLASLYRLFEIAMGVNGRSNHPISEKRNIVYFHAIQKGDLSETPIAGLIAVTKLISSFTFRGKRLEAFDLSKHVLNSDDLKQLAKNCPYLKIIALANLGGEYFESLPRNLTKLVLQHMSITDDQLSSLPQSLKSLSINDFNVTSLTNSGFVNLPRSLQTLSWLPRPSEDQQALSITGESFKLLPENLVDLALQYVNFTDDQLLALPSTLISLSLNRFNAINLTNSSFRNLPRKLQRLSWLPSPTENQQVLSLTGESFKFLPRNLDSLILNFVSFIDEELLTLPQSLTSLSLINFSAINLTASCFENLPRSLQQLWWLPLREKYQETLFQQQLNLLENNLKNLLPNLAKFTFKYLKHAQFESFIDFIDRKRPNLKLHVRWNDDSEYSGSWLKGEPNGFGTLIHSDGTRYVGNWKNGEFHGHGTETLPDGTIYVGNWEKGNLHGQATALLLNGEKYVGNWVNGKRHGQGIMVYPDGRTYEGNWEAGNFQGQGTLTYPDMTKYVGNWKGGKRHGHGTETFPDGTIYVGNWENDDPCGYGTETFSDGTIYAGFWQENNRHGEGTMTYSDGSKYTGEWKDDQRHGQGTLTFTDGSKYEGSWEDDSYHGQGTMTYSGENFRGQAMLSYDFEVKYVGEWKNGKRHGQGSVVYSDGTKRKLQWKEGQPYLAKKSCLRSSSNP